MRCVSEVPVENTRVRLLKLLAESDEYVLLPSLSPRVSEGLEVVDNLSVVLDVSGEPVGKEPRNEQQTAG